MENQSPKPGNDNRKVTRADRLRAQRARNGSSPAEQRPQVSSPRPVPNGSPASTPPRGARSYSTPNGFVRQQQSPPFRPARKRFELPFDFELPFNLNELNVSPQLLKRIALFSVLPLTIALVLLLIFTPRSHTPHAYGSALPTPTLDPLQQALKVAGKTQASGRTNILVMGSDQRPDDPGYRTDTIILVSIDADNNKVSVVSFPRDLYVDVPDMYPMKINQIMGFGKFESMQKMFEKNWGVRIDHYVMTNFQGFMQIVNDLGGLDVEVGQTLTDACDLPQAVDGDCTVDPGTVKMDGPTALWYIRSRETSSDYDRLRRAQEVGWAAFRKMITLNAITRLPELYSSYNKTIQTDMRPADMLPLMPLAARVFKDKSLMSQAVIGEEQASPSWAYDGMWILLPDNEAIKQVLQNTGVR